MSNQQQPVGSGFGAASTADEVIAGIDAQVRAMDLLDPASIAAFAASMAADTPALRILVNSAGIMAVPELRRDARGYEIQFATNHLGHFQLTTALLPLLRAARGARVVSVSSLGHRYADVSLDDPNFERRDYHPFAAYGQSKTANILFAVELDRREREHGVRAFSLHPGSIVETGLGKHVTREQLIEAGVLDAQGQPIRDPSRQLKTVGQGAATQVWCATSPKLDGLGGLYCENVDVAPLRDESPREIEMADAMRIRGVSPYAVDPVQAGALWTLSEQLLAR
ncbi:SDR family NAD(P)-dependent oxidoreductase [Burkholderia gladioli]|uniref:SDR family NAD(P)-dependent oxidoreductase n=1 Tax=Burkholderia gladioli TaxID=28095 RepID=UPI0022D03AD7|nr:SDR family NAD(P)-dependent oxidoreductase [Burkholderia gladioli]MDA0571409.1 SDR family NAD(P)-dependent oxidoreductase [Burkholderia gladioli]MDA0599453.1 SDR family NAD(P)-dependent oxidoreductase [Burkholderia gladioli]